ncbi:MAG TPA: cell division protein FtsZ [Opitutales bacterium]|nr:cell division protein FtsZ [Opitutales bacterium]
MNPPNSSPSSADRILSGNLPEEGVRVKIVGVGGAGTNAVDRLQLDQDSPRLRLATLNTDAQALASSPAPEKLLIGRGLTRGAGTGGEPDVGRNAAEGDCELIAKMFQGMDVVFIVAGLGGGTGSGAGPVVAQIATQAGALVVAFVMLPFTTEGGRRRQIADAALAELRQHCDAVIPLPNDLLLQHLPDESTVLDAFGQADAWIGRAIRSIAAILFNTGLINLDFATLRRTFSPRGGKTLFGLGQGAGENCVAEALHDLMLCPLLHTPELSRRADRLLINILGGPELSLARVNEIVGAIAEKFGSREHTVLGAVIDERLSGKVEICVIGVAETRAKPATALRTAPAGLRADAPAVPASTSTASLFPKTAAATPSTAPAPQPMPVHASKLRGSKSGGAPQNEFHFVGEDEQRGYFDQTDRNFFEGEDLDVPTYLRRGIKIEL